MRVDRKTSEEDKQWVTLQKTDELKIATDFVKSLPPAQESLGIYGVGLNSWLRFESKDETSVISTIWVSLKPESSGRGSGGENSLQGTSYVEY